MSIEIVPYDPAWPAAFEAEAARVREALGAAALRIDHNGSTSVPGLAAKPQAMRAHSHHIHVVEAGGTEERRTLAFRDYLRDHAQAARAYERLKRDLALRAVGSDPESHEEYARSKTDFIEQVIATALAAGYPRR